MPGKFEASYLLRPALLMAVLFLSGCAVPSGNSGFDPTAAEDPKIDLSGLYTREKWEKTGNFGQAKP